MMRTAITSAVVVAALTAIPTAAQQTPLRSTTNGVVIGVTVTSGTRDVRGLTASDFRLRDNGVTQQFQVLSGNQPLDLSLWLDSSGSVAEPERLWRDAADIAAMLRAGDRFELFLFGNSARLVVPMHDVPVTLPAPPRISTSSTKVLDAVAQSLIRPGTPVRRHIVAFLTDRDDNSSMATPSQIEQVAERSDATFFLVTSKEKDPMLFGPPPDPRNRNAIKRALARAAEITGGRIVSADKAVNGFRTLLSELDNSYVLAYSPEGVASGGWHEINVELTKPGNANVRARRGYFGG
jgi:VWFA-related protein